jgi:hypothetical protein
MNFEWVIACKFAEVHRGEDLATIVGAGIEELRLPELPTDASMRFALSVIITPEDVGQPATVILSVRGPDLEPVFTTERPFLATRQPHPLEGWTGRHMLTADLTFAVRAYGTYSVSFTVKGGDTIVYTVRCLPQPNG